jgi:outer membrane protein OmpA-like peptidoglycan-associated protein
LLNNYEVVDVKIAGYTDNVGLPERNMALSREWAQIITNQLWANGLDARVVYATGYGDLDPIGDNETVVNRAVNRRIEITLKLPPAPYVW